MEAKKSNVIYLGAAFVLGMLILGGSLVLMVNNLKSYDRCVTVKGLCEKEVMADKVIWPIVYKQGGNDLSELYNRVKDMNGVIVKFLKDAGVTDAEITTNAPSILDTQTNLYGERKEYRYIVTAGVTVCSEKVDLIVKLQTEQAKLYEKGIPVGMGEKSYFRVWVRRRSNQAFPSGEGGSPIVFKARRMRRFPSSMDNETIV